MEKDFLKLPLAIQMAIVSFGIGTLLLILHFIFKKSDIMFNVKSSILSLETTSPFDFIKLNN